MGIQIGHFLTFVISMAAPKLFSGFLKVANLARQQKSVFESLDSSVEISNEELFGIVACYSNVLGVNGFLPSLKTPMFTKKRKERLFEVLNRFDVSKILDTLRVALPKITMLSTIANDLLKLHLDEENFMLAANEINLGIEKLCQHLNWKEDEIAAHGSYLAILLNSYFRLDGLKLKFWYNCVMQLACYKKEFYKVPNQFIVPGLNDDFKASLNDRQCLKQNYNDVMTFVQNPKKVSTCEILKTVLKITKNDGSFDKEKIEDLKNFPLLLHSIGESCSWKLVNFGGKKRKNDDDPDFETKVRRVTRSTKRASELVDDISTEPVEVKIPIVRMTKRIKIMQECMQEISTKQTIFDEALNVGKYMLSRSPLSKKDPFGLILLFNGGVKDTHFVHVPIFVSKFYQPYYYNPRLDRNTYIGLFLGFYPVWILITNDDVVFYLLSPELMLKDSLYSTEINAFNRQKIATYNPNFDACDIFEYSAFGVDLLPTLLTQTVINLSMLNGECPFDFDFNRQIPASHVIQFQSGIHTKMTNAFQSALKVFTDANSDVFIPLHAVCEKSSTPNTKDEIQSMFCKILADLAKLSNLYLLASKTTHALT